MKKNSNWEEKRDIWKNFDQKEYLENNQKIFSVDDHNKK